MFEFHYFFMRKFWFAYLAKALVVFPGGFGTLDELTEILTLAQTQKLEKKMTVILYGTTFWKEILNFDALVRHGMIAEKDLELFSFADDVETAFSLLEAGLTKHYIQPDAPGAGNRQIESVESAREPPDNLRLDGPGWNRVCCFHAAVAGGGFFRALGRIENSWPPRVSLSPACG